MTHSRESHFEKRQARVIKEVRKHTAIESLVAEDNTTKCHVL